MRVQIDVDMNTAKVAKRMEGIGGKALLWLKNEVAKDSEPFVPLRSGILTRSVMASIRTPDDALIYNTIYARRMYYGDHYAFRRDVHPQASARWFEKAKAIHKPKWLKGVQAFWGAGK